MAGHEIPSVDVAQCSSCKLPGYPTVSQEAIILASPNIYINKQTRPGPSPEFCSLLNALQP